jgi:outer membrane protein assembly factor BamB
MFRMAIVVCASVLSAVAADWPQFRGPNGTGVVDDHSLPAHFRPGEEIWKVAVPPGHSSPVIANGHLYVTAAVGEELLTIAFDAQTGKERWRRQPPRDRRERLDKRNSPASPSPAADRERVVVFFPDFGLLAYTHSGRELWRTRLGPFDNSYGMGASPILVDGNVVLVCDQSKKSFIAAFNARNGQLVWKMDRPHAISGHSTPAVHRSGTSTLVLAPASFRMDAYNAKTGKLAWWVDRLPSEMKSVPVVHGGTVFVSGYNLAENEPGRQVQLPPFKEVLAGHDKDTDGLLSQEESPDEMTRRYYPYVDLDHNGRMDEREWTMYAAAFRAENSLQAVRLNGQGDVTATNVMWKYHRAIPQLPSVVVYRGDLYMISDNGVLTILEAETGNLRRQVRLNGVSAAYFASPVAGDEKVIFVSNDGIVTVLRAGGDYDVLSKSQLGETTFASPALSDGSVYIRTAGHLFRFGTSRTPSQTRFDRNTAASR